MKQSNATQLAIALANLLLKPNIKTELQNTIKENIDGLAFDSDREATEMAAQQMLSHELYYNILGYEYDQPNAHDYNEAPGCFVCETFKESDWLPIAQQLIDELS